MKTKGFLATEFPTQYLAQRVSRLGLYLGTNIVLWGIVLCCHAGTTSFAGLAVCRTLLGVFEACVAPILVLIIAMWYRKEEQGTRVSWFYVCNSVTKIFGGLVAYGISFATTTFATWRIFLLAIGALTVGIGVLVCVFLPDSPVKAKRFSDAEKVAALMRVKENQRYYPIILLHASFTHDFSLSAERKTTTSRKTRSSKPSATSASGSSS